MHQVVSKPDWTAARIAFLEKEKAFTRARDELAAARRALPWEKVETNYVFEGENGPVALADLFRGKSQLIVYRKRLGGTMQWVSSLNNSFNQDFAVSFPSDKDRAGKNYNFGTIHFDGEEAPGLSVFARADGAIFHT